MTSKSRITQLYQRREFKSEKPRLSTQIAAGQDHYWRARARDEKGRIISEFSPAYTLKGVAKPVPQMLAKEEPKRRKPAQDEPQPESSVSSRTERIKRSPGKRAAGGLGWVLVTITSIIAVRTRTCDFKRSGSLRSFAVL